MKTNYLFPNWVKKPALIVLLISILFGLYVLYINNDPKIFQFARGHSNGIFSSDHINLSNTIAGVLVIISAMLFAFSREKEEDEFLSKIRLESLVWATYVNYGLLLISFLVIYDLNFINVMIFNMFTLLIFFIVRFQIYKYKLQKSLNNEE